MSDINRIIKAKTYPEKELRLHPEDSLAIKHFQEECYRLIEDITLLDESGSDYETLKAAVDLICQCCKTRICSRSSGGYEIIEPAIVSPDIRAFCAEKYDEWTARIKEADRMYMPEPFERETPDRGRLLFLQKQYLSARSTSAAAAQEKGRSFNRLFGSRG